MERTEFLNREMSSQDFALLGIHQVAFVKPGRREGEEGFAVFAADGTEIAFIQNERDVAFAAVRQHDLEPVSVH